MGKTHKMWVEPEAAEQQVDIPRSVLVDFIDKSIASALRAYPGDAILLGDEALRRLARTTDKIDAGTFLCQNSCGCPLTAAGRVKVDIGHGTNEPLPPMFVSFYTAFDNLMQRRYGPGPTTATVVAG